MSEERPERSLRELFRELAEGRPEALEPLYRALADDVYGLALWRTGSAADAADVLQEVFVRLARAGSRLRRVREPRSYVLTMAHRASIDIHRRARTAALDESIALVEPNSVPAGRVLEAVHASRALHELPAEQRESIYLHLFNGCSFSEVGRATGVSTFTAASRFRLGLERLRKILGVKR